MNAWTRKAIEAEGPTTTVPVLAAALGVNKDTLYEEIRRGKWTLTRVLRIGRCIKIPTADIVTLLYAPESARDSSNDEAEHHCASGSEIPSSGAIASHTQCGCRVTESAVIRPLRGA